MAVLLSPFRLCLQDCHSFAIGAHSSVRAHVKFLPLWPPLCPGQFVSIGESRQLTCAFAPFTARLCRHSVHLSCEASSSFRFSSLCGMRLFFWICISGYQYFLPFSSSGLSTAIRIMYLCNLPFLLFPLLLFPLWLPYVSIAFHMPYNVTYLSITFTLLYHGSIYQPASPRLLSCSTRTSHTLSSWLLTALFDSSQHSPPVAAPLLHVFVV